MPIYYDRYGRPIRPSALRPTPLRVPVNGNGQRPAVSADPLIPAVPARQLAESEQLQAVLAAATERIDQLQDQLAQANEQIDALQDQLVQAQDRIDALKEQAAQAVQAQAERDDYRDKYLRLAADFENSRKRLERLYEHQAAEARQRLLRDFLPLADNLERALAHAEVEGDDALRQGVELTLRAFSDALARHGVRPLRPQPGEAFDPEWHEAIAMLPGQDLESGSIAHVEETGYALGDKLLRPARVIVAQ